MYLKSGFSVCWFLFGLVHSFFSMTLYGPFPDLIYAICKKHPARVTIYKAIRTSAVWINFQTGFTYPYLTDNPIRSGRKGYTALFIGAGIWTVLGGFD